MKKNKEVIEDFLNGKTAIGSNLYSTGTKLINYNTVIAEWDLEKLYINTTRYSKTTSVHQNYILRIIKDWPFIYINKKDIPMSTQDLVKDKEKYF